VLVNPLGDLPAEPVALLSKDRAMARTHRVGYE
jgi:hypothetical protein